MNKQTIKQQVNIVQNRDKIADAKRSDALNILNLGNILNVPKTQAEQILESINVNSGENTRPLQLADLKQLKTAMQYKQKDFKSLGIRGGIHPRSIINQSRREDIQRSTKEINTASPVSKNNKGIVIFRVNASAQSNANHHLVKVEFLNFQAALSGGLISNKLAQAVLQGPIKFDCDCGRHRFWFRYIASIGGFAYGRAETGFPKIRNPNLSGLACKHVLYVMRMLIKSPIMVRYMKDYLAHYRSDPNKRAKTAGIKQADKLEKALAKESWKKLAVRKTNHHPMPKDIRDVFNPAKKMSIKGMKLTPDMLSKNKANNMPTQLVARELQQKLQNPDVLNKLSPEVLNQIQQLITGNR